MAETQELESGTPTATENATPAWKRVQVPTEGLPRFVKAFYNTSFGKLLFYVTSDAGRFLRVGVTLAAVLGLLYTIFHMWSLRGAPFSVIWASFFFDLLITLVAAGILYGLRVMAEVAEKQR